MRQSLGYPGQINFVVDEMIYLLQIFFCSLDLVKPSHRRYMEILLVTWNNGQVSKDLDPPSQYDSVCDIETETIASNMV